MLSRKNENTHRHYFSLLGFRYRVFRSLLLYRRCCVFIWLSQSPLSRLFLLVCSTHPRGYLFPVFRPCSVLENGPHEVPQLPSACRESLYRGYISGCGLRVQAGPGLQLCWLPLFTDSLVGPAVYNNSQRLVCYSPKKHHRSQTVYGAELCMCPGFCLGKTGSLSSPRFCFCADYG